MAINKVSKGRVGAGSVVFGAGIGGKITGVLTGTVSVTPGTIASGARSQLDVTITGVRAGDIVYLEPHVSMTAGNVVGAIRVKASDTVTIDITNATSASITDSTARAWAYTVLRTS